MKKSLVSFTCICLILCFTGCGGTASERAQSEVSSALSSAAGNAEASSKANDSGGREVKSDSSEAEAEEKSREESSTVSAGEKAKAESAQADSSVTQKDEAKTAQSVQQGSVAAWNEKAGAQNETGQQSQTEGQVQMAPGSGSQTTGEEGGVFGVTASTEGAQTAASPAEAVQTTPVQTAPAPAQEQTVFDINHYVEYAKSYAQSIGLQTDKVSTGSWDNPISANAALTNIEENIRGRLDRYKNVEGFTGVWVWAQEASEGKYEIYMGYY